MKQAAVPCVVEVEGGVPSDGGVGVAADGRPSASAVYRNVGADPDLPLVSTLDGCSTLLELWEATVQRSPHHLFLGRRLREPGHAPADHYVWETFREVAMAVTWLAQSLACVGIDPSDRVGVLGPNCSEWIKVMLACSSACATCVPLYATLGAPEMAHVVAHSGMSIAFVHIDQLNHLLGVLAAATGRGTVFALRRVVVWGQASSERMYDEQLASVLGIQLDEWVQFERTCATKIDVQTQERRKPKPRDICTIMYTSGTTGLPKGVTLSHQAMVAVVASQAAFMQDPWSSRGVAAAQQRAQRDVERTAAAAAGRVADEPTGPPTGPELEAFGAAAPPAARPVPDHLPSYDPLTDAHLSYLPLAHIFERVCVETAIALGARIGFWTGEIDRLQEDAEVLRPAIFVGVPRVYERVHQTVKGKMAKRPISRWLFRVFYQRKLARLRAGLPQSLASRFGDWLVFSKVRAALGGQLKMAVSGASALSADTEEFMRVCLGCVAGQGYGLTESCSATCVAWPDCFEQFGTVGPPQTCADVRLVSVPEMGYDAAPAASSGGDSRNSALPRGELCLRGPCLFSGYFNDPEATEQAMDDEGFFHTGDIVQLEPSGALRVIDRKKALLKLSQGEYVSPERVEAVLRGCDSISQAVVYAQLGGRRLVALVVPHFDTLLAWSAGGSAPVPQQAISSSSAARGRGPGSGGGGMQRQLDPAEVEHMKVVCESAAAREYVLGEARAASLRAGLAGFEFVHAVRLLPEEWTPENGLLTPSHKLIRHKIRERFAAQLEAMVRQVGGNSSTGST